jgi:hypothetical protein
MGTVFTTFADHMRLADSSSLIVSREVLRVHSVVGRLMYLYHVWMASRLTECTGRCNEELGKSSGTIGLDFVQ